jgi:polygalacturonase
MATRRRDFLKLSGVGAASSLLATSAAARGSAAPPHGSARENFDVRAFGAKGDGHSIDTPAINRTIDAAAAAGGGIVQFPAGSYACYSIHLKSNLSLYLGPGATIVAAETPASASGGYDAPEPNQWAMYQDFGHSHWHNSLIWGEDVSNISIYGPGRIWGKGLSRGSGDKPLAPGVGNKSIALKNCHNITLRDFSILHGGHFGILATGADNLTIDNLLIDTNRDAMDIDCCRNVRISNCTVNSPWDDGYCLKSSYGLGYARSTDNVTITNCYATGGYVEGTVLDGTWKKWPADHHVPRIGRIKFGTESNGGFRNITVTNCVCEDCHGIALETVDGAMLEDVSISNIAMRGIVDVPFFLRLGARMRSPGGVAVGQLRRVLFSDVVVSMANTNQAAIVSGIPGHEIEDVRFSNILLRVPGGGTKEQAAIDPPELEDGYPEPSRFGPMPAYGFFVRHVKGIELRDLEIQTLQPDARPAFALNQVDGAEFSSIKTPRGSGPTWSLANVRNFNISQSRPFLDSFFESIQQRTL